MKLRIGMDDSFTQMREYIMVTERLLQAEYGLESDQEQLLEVVVPSNAETLLVEEMAEVVFKLRAFTESSDGEVGYGIEMGMQRAADMIETRNFVE